MLELKAQVKELFQDAGIPELTVSRGINGYLTIVGKECGQPIMTISQVEIPAKLTKATRSIVIDDYLIPALDKHTVDFINLIKTKKTVKALQTKVDKEWKKLSKLGYSEQYNYNSNKAISLIERDKNEKVIISLVINTITDAVNISTLDFTIKQLEDNIARAKLVKAEIKPWLTAKEGLDKANEALKIESDKLKTVCGW